MDRKPHHDDLIGSTASIARVSAIGGSFCGDPVSSILRFRVCTNGRLAAAVVFFQMHSLPPAPKHLVSPLLAALYASKPRHARWIEVANTSPLVKEAGAALAFRDGHIMIMIIISNIIIIIINIIIIIIIIIIMISILLIIIIIISIIVLITVIILVRPHHCDSSPSSSASSSSVSSS